MHIYFVSDGFEDWHCYDVLTLMIWMSCSHTIEFYFDTRKKYHPGCHDMVDTFLCRGGVFHHERRLLFYIPRRDHHLLRRGHAIIRDMDFSSLDDTTWLTLSHVMVTIYCFSLQSFAPHFRSQCSFVFSGTFRSSSSSFQSSSNFQSSF